MRSALHRRLQALERSRVPERLIVFLHSFSGEIDNPARVIGAVTLERGDETAEEFRTRCCAAAEALPAAAGRFLVLEEVNHGTPTGFTGY